MTEQFSPHGAQGQAKQLVHGSRSEWPCSRQPTVAIEVKQESDVFSALCVRFRGSLFISIASAFQLGYIRASGLGAYHGCHGVLWTGSREAAGVRERADRIQAGVRVVHHLGTIAFGKQKAIQKRFLFGAHIVETQEAE